jgi:hypothetical protein
MLLGFPISQWLLHARAVLFVHSLAVPDFAETAREVVTNWNKVGAKLDHP